MEEGGDMVPLKCPECMEDEDDDAVEVPNEPMWTLEAP
jgi:hypothetical protein